MADKTPLVVYTGTGVDGLHTGDVLAGHVAFTTGTAAPNTTPARAGLMFIDTLNGKVYVSTGSSSSANWKILN